MEKVVKKVDQMLITAKGEGAAEEACRRSDHHYVHHYCCGSWYCGTFVYFWY